MVSSQGSMAARPDLPAWCVRLICELDAADHRAEAVAGNLSLSQLNWQPSPGVWSVGQCLEHLRKGNEEVVAAVSAALEGRPQKRVDEITLGWLTRSFIRTYIAPNPGGKRAKAPKKIEPVQQIGPGT